jgi:hypothetical protein
MSRITNSVEHTLQRQLLDARNSDGGWGYERGRKSRLEPTCWALLALRSSLPPADRTLADWPSRSGALVEQRDGLPNWSFHSLALAIRLGLAEASGADVQSLAGALVAARGIALEPSPVLRQNSALQGWSWVTGTFSWSEPTAWALVALKKCRARGIAVKGAEGRIRDGEAILRDRVCATGGWNYGNSNAFGRDLPAYIPTTAIALLALQDCVNEAFVQDSITFLEEQAGSHPSTRALALSTLALRRHGRAASPVEGALRAWLATHPTGDVASLGMALYALEKTDGDEFAY